MCGRYASWRGASDLADEFGVEEIDPMIDEIRPSWNIAPTDLIRMVVERADKAGRVSRQLRTARWGLVPSWAKDPSIGSRMINARAETILDKPSFAKPFAARRALLPADGYYEWQRDGSSKRPHFIRPADGRIAALAGIFEFWRDPASPTEWLVTAAIITTAASGSLAEIHPRRPVLMAPESWDTWLSPGTSAEQSLVLLDDDVPLAWYPVSDQVNRVANNSADLTQPLSGD